jgi:hypothetical protein
MKKRLNPPALFFISSAASLAYDAKELWEAQQLIVEGLSGYPSPRIKQALKSLYEKINAELQKKVRTLTFKSEYAQPLHC